MLRAVQYVPENFPKENFSRPLYKPEKDCYNVQAKKCASGSMDRASDSGSEGWGFESLLAYQESRYSSSICSFVYP